MRMVALPRQLNRRGVAHYVPATFLSGKRSWHVSRSCHPLFAMWSGGDATIRLYPDSDSLSYGSFSALAGGGKDPLEEDWDWLQCVGFWCGE
ncbi:hypothetical protein HMPREF0294_2281 [Corynebacterium glucuronolyticum ATCC 51867]|nr:hypothetical protein HMPREF0294_2281 [Corynebacterium glucuronolyticum ATCC 51867]